MLRGWWRGGRDVQPWPEVHQEVGDFRLLWFGLGFLWLLDAALQLQPAMFTAAFSQAVLWNNVYMYQPPALAQLLAQAARVETGHLVLLDAVVVAIQVACGISLFFWRTRLAGLWLGLAWAVAVWVLGEGLGFLATGTAQSISGAPGSALMYAALSLVGLMALRHGRVVGVRSARVAWTSYWLLGALLQLPIRYGAGAVLAYNLQTAAQELPGPLSRLDYSLAHQAFVHPLPSALGVALIELGLAVAIWWRPTALPCLLAGMLLSVPFWVLGQGMGGITTGVATDPSTAPSVVLLGLVLWRALSGRPRLGAAAAERGGGAVRAAAVQRGS